ncbi:unnamed protein product, partial [marine sediment metagenome]
NNADTDDDNDGMPDDWEILYSFNPLDPSDAGEDADGDGVSNLDEYLQGTNPRDGAGVGNWAFDEGSGTTAADASSFGNDGTLNGSPVWTTGISGSALDFSGGADRVLVPDSPSLDVSEQITIAAWVKPRNIGTQYVVKKGRYGISDGYELSLSGGGQAFVRFNQASAGNAYKLYSQSYYPTDGDTWMHISATYDGQEIKFYVDGVLETSSNAQGLVIATNSNDLSIGAQDDGLKPVDGVIDQVHIYNYALTATDIQDLVN